MSIKLNHDYVSHLRDAKPTFLGSRKVHPPKGALGDIQYIPEQTIPPVNTDIQFDVLPKFELSKHPGLAALDHTTLPENFNWRENGGNKQDLISTPGNQMLCGSCWAISTAGIVADNHVISNTVNWKPNLSTTWSLACYPQAKCKGGNPARLFQSISKGGLASNHCVDYSWCAENKYCNGKATHHFKAGETIDLSALIPNCGCYNNDSEHYLYFIDNPESISMNTSGMNPETFTNTVKKHIFHYGPVQGGFLVFRNFMSGAFAKTNGGIYFEHGVYDKNKPVHFDVNQTNSANYVGSHAVAVIGWGIEKNVVVDNNGTKKNVPYWYCRNSWTEKWGNGGYFKMAMFPFNKIAQFDRTIRIQTPIGIKQGGGMVMIRASKGPEKRKLSEISSQFQNLPRLEPNSFYEGENHDQGDQGNQGNSSNNTTRIFNFLKFIIALTLAVVGVLWVIRRLLIRRY